MPCKLVCIKTESGRAKVGDCIAIYPQEKGLGKSPRIETVFDIVSVTNADYDDSRLANLTAPWFINNPAWVMGDDTQPEFIEHPEYNTQFYLAIPDNIERPLTIQALLTYVVERNG